MRCEEIKETNQFKQILRHATLHRFI